MKKRIALMSLYVRLFAVSAALVSCASVEIPEIKPHVTLPATRNGFWVSTLTLKEGEIPAHEWEKKLINEPHIIIFSDDWGVLRFTILKNCLTMDCKQAVGTFDFLFDAAEKALKERNKLRK